MFAFPDSPAVGEVFEGGGQSWQWDGTAWVSTGLLATSNMIERIYLTAQTWTKPAGLAYLEVEGSAPGGSGCGALNGGASTWAFGSSGGSGAWGKKLFTAAELPDSVALTPGAAGAPTSGGVAAVSSNATFGSLITLPAGNRGNQGANVTSSAAPQFAAGGAATAAPTGVDIGAPGAPGDYAMAGITGQASTSYCLVGASGTSPYGANTYQMISTGFGPLGATGYGAGGSGACNFGSVAARAGGQGAPGFWRVREFYTQAVGVSSNIITPWVAYVPTFTGLGTPTNVAFFSRRVGSSLQVRGRFAGGTPTGTEARITLGYNGVNGGVVGDPAQLPAQCIAGNAIQSSVGANIFYPLAEPSIGYLTFGCQNAARSALAKLIGTDMTGAGITWNVVAEVPISGW